MSENLAGLVETLVSIPSPTGDEGAAAAALEAQLTGIGLTVRRQTVDEHRFNLVATTDQAPRVLLCSHIDVVSPHIPFTRIGSTLFGRGVCDAKAALASMAFAAARLLEEGEGRFGLLFVVGEEQKSDGAKKAASLDLGSRFVVIGEPTENCLVTAQKGTLVFRLDFTGVAGHSAVPDTGHSAIHEMARTLGDWLDADWGDDPELGETTLNFGLIGGGAGANVIAGQAYAEGIFRISTSVEQVSERARALLPESARLSVVSQADPLFLHTVPGFPQTIVSFGSDAPHLEPLGRVLMLGPGSINHAHSDDEQVTIQELEEADDHYTNLVRILNREP